MTAAPRQMLVRALRAPGSPEERAEQARVMLQTEIALSKAHGASPEYLQPWQDLLTMLETLGPERTLETLSRE